MVYKSTRTLPDTSTNYKKSRVNSVIQSRQQTPTGMQLPISHKTNERLTSILPVMSQWGKYTLIPPFGFLSHPPRATSISYSDTTMIPIICSQNPLRIGKRPVKSRLSRAAVLQPTFHIFDNEVSTDLIAFLESDENITVQLAPTGCHRRNAAERAIRTFKNLFIAGL